MTMTSFLELANRRCSVRAYSSVAVEAEKLDYVLEAARLAPSAVNKQPWKIYVISPESDAELRLKVQQCYDREWFKSAPYYLILCIEHDQSWHRGNDGKDHGDIDIAILAEHICLAAADVGLGTCWVCNFDARLCHELFGFRDEEEPAVLIPLGYAADGFEAKEKVRKDLGDIVVRCFG